MKLPKKLIFKKMNRQ